MNSPKVQKALDEAFMELHAMSHEEFHKELTKRVEDLRGFMDEEKEFNHYLDISSRQFLRQT
jgi:predicted HTH domain antitoxin